MGRVLIDQGDVAEGMGHLDEAMLFAVEGRLGPYSTGKVYCSLISACEEVGDLDRAAEWTEATMRWAQQHPFAIFPGICRVHRAVVLKRRGSLAEAEREAAQACEELIGSHLVNSAAAYAEVGDIRRRLGELDRADEAFARAQELCGRPCGGLALLRLAQGRVDAAMTMITGCLQDTGRTGWPGRRCSRCSSTSPSRPATSTRRRGALDELDEIADAFDTPLLQATARSTRGRLSSPAGRRRPPAPRCTRPIEGWQALDVPYEVATARTLLGQAQREAGDAAAAAASFEAAAAAVRRDRRPARRPARCTATASRTTPAGLTDREVEVLRLLATGLTNNEIAAELYLSAKTVSRHLSNIFTKIGVSSRAAATAFAFEHDLADPRH